MEKTASNPIRTTESVTLSDYGGIENIKISTTKLSHPSANEVLVAVTYCGINFADIYTSLGLVKVTAPPFTMGIECAGVVTETGANCTALKVNDRVICYNYLGGMHTKHLTIDERKCFRIPGDVTDKEAVVIFVNYLTAYVCLFKLGALQPDSTILIHSCAGGVGWAATQLAGLVDNVTVHGTCSKSKHEQVKSNGVHNVADYDEFRRGQIESPEKYDLILDNQSAGVLHASLCHLKPFGKEIVIGANYATEPSKTKDLDLDLSNKSSIDPITLIVNNISVAGCHLGVIAENSHAMVQEMFELLCRWYREKKFKIRIDSEWEFSEIMNAYKRLTERVNVGKVIVRIK